MFEADADDAQLDSLIKQFTAEVEKTGKAGGSISAQLTPDEMKRARYIELGAAGNDVHDDSSPPKNQYKKLCATCGWPDLDNIPEPLIVSKQIRKKPKQELFLAEPGMLIVSSRAMSILKSAIGDQIRIGPACVAGEDLKKITESDRFYYIRPIHSVGEERNLKVLKRCSACKRIIDVRTREDVRDPNDEDERSKRLYDHRQYLASFGEHDADLAHAVEPYWQLRADKAPPFMQKLYISGSLVMHLEKQKVKGIELNPLRFTEMCFFSLAGEPPLRQKPREFATSATAVPPHRRSRSEEKGSRPKAPARCGFVEAHREMAREQGKAHPQDAGRRREREADRGRGEEAQEAASAGRARVISHSQRRDGIGSLSQFDLRRHGLQPAHAGRDDARFQRPARLGRLAEYLAPDRNQRRGGLPRGGSGRRRRERVLP
jgi:hypothetical protein